MKMIFEYVFWVDIKSLKTRETLETNILVPYQSHIKMTNIKEFLIATDQVKKFVVRSLQNPRDNFYRGMKFRLETKMIQDFEYQLQYDTTNFRYIGETEVKDKK